MTIETDPDNVDQARADLTRRQRALARLREAFLNAEPGVKWAQIKTEEAALEETEARIERAARTKARAAETERQATLGTIRQEIDDYVGPLGDTLTGLLKAVEDAAVAFAQAHETHNRRVNDWRTRLLAAGAQNAHQQHTDTNHGLNVTALGTIQAGNRELHRINSGQTLQELLKALPVAHNMDVHYFTADQSWSPTLAALYTRVAATAPDVTTTDAPAA